MLSVGLGRDEVLAYQRAAPGEITLAVSNGTSSSVLSGSDAALDDVERTLVRDGVRVKRIPVTYASHSPLVAPLESEILAELSDVTARPGQVPFCSTVTGDFVDTGTLDAAYWYRNLRERVEFQQATTRLVESGHTTFVEISPHPVLVPALAETLAELDVAATATGTLHRDLGGSEDFLRSMAEVVVAGVRPDPALLYAGQGASLVDLPTYAFQHSRFWLADEVPTVGTAEGGEPVDSEFWAAVEAGVPGGLADLLGVPEEESALARVLPAIARWDRRRRGRSTAAGWRYHVSWVPVDAPSRTRLTGRWLVLAGEDRTAVVGEIVAALSSAGADPFLLRLPDGVDRETAAAALAPEAGTALQGVISTVSLDVTADEVHGVLTRGLTATLAVVNALGDTGIHAPFWLITQDSAIPDAGTPVRVAAAGRALGGLGRVIGLERPDRWGGQIDVPAVLGARGATGLAAVLGVALGGRGPAGNPPVRDPRAPVVPRYRRP
jgi:KS-AT-KR-ACP domain-containing polyene macrolide polyketide synthase/pimaricinolide synthase PimS2/candicidin polyketide synthase FscD